MKKFFRDILRDANSTKFSNTKFISFAAFLLFFAHIVIAIIVAYQTQHVDHIIVLELMGFILTLNGFKNGFGVTSRNTDKETVCIDEQQKAPEIAEPIVEPKEDEQEEDDAVF